MDDETNLWQRAKGRLLRGGRAAPEGCAVVFTVPKSRLKAMEVSSGPCVPVGGRKHPVTSVHQQVRNERPDRMQALFTALTGRPREEAMAVLAEDGPGQLWQCSQAFVDAMADANRVLVEAGEADLASRDKAYTRFTDATQKLGDAWRTELGLAPGTARMEKFLHVMANADMAKEKGQHVYAWYGPLIPEYTIAQGSGPRRGRGSDSRT